jgi:hypothetical protein
MVAGKNAAPPVQWVAAIPAKEAVELAVAPTAAVMAAKASAGHIVRPIAVWTAIRAAPELAAKLAVMLAVITVGVVVAPLIVMLFVALLVLMIVEGLLHAIPAALRVVVVVY